MDKIDVLSFGFGRKLDIRIIILNDYIFKFYNYVINYEFLNE